MIVTYDRPVQATLLVRLANGEEWEATPEDLAKFRLVNRSHAYSEFRAALTRILTDHDLIGTETGPADLTDTALNPLRYLVETVLVFPDVFDHPEHEMDWEAVAELERRLRALPVTDAVTDGDTDADADNSTVHLSLT